MTESSKPRDPFEFYKSPWWNDMCSKFCTDGWPHVVVALNCMVRDAKEAHDAALARIKSLETDYEGALSDLSEMNERIKVLEEVCAELMRALKLIADDLDIIGITPTEISHLAISKNSLASAREKIGGGK